MSYDKGRKSTPTRSLRGEKKPTFTEFPDNNKIVLGILSEIAAEMKDGFYQGKISSTGGIKVTIYQEDENVTDYFSYLDEPVAYLVLITETCWGAAVTKNALKVFAARSGMKPQEVADLVNAIPR